MAPPTTSTYIQGYDASTLKSHQSRTAEKQADYLIPHIKPTHRVLDIGCGPGTITCDFAQHYAFEGQVTGIDFSEEVLSQARKEAANRNITNVTFQFGQADQLPFDKDSFDIVHCHAVLVHAANAKAVLKEMYRVCTGTGTSTSTREGGIVGIREPDWATCVIHPYDPLLERWKELSAEMKRRQGAEPNAGRHLAEWAVAAGFSPDRIQVTCNVLQYSGKEEVKFWGELYAKRVHTEFGERAVENGYATESEVEDLAQAYLKWSKCETGIWAMTHMRLLCHK